MSWRDAQRCEKTGLSAQQELEAETDVTSCNSLNKRCFLSECVTLSVLSLLFIMMLLAGIFLFDLRILDAACLLQDIDS
ncbi:hypothetical protein NPIL_397001 [Nephila pilipes]|uniref:Uncharacterized protein n=1 Tax=Nephila pilipes TaxID=299642 RepID=A0A8X6U1H4_NEPPI|nr:hypothetical protein NPIL_397001 [Nephila pilipes]